jgi:hypothetical protein
MDVMEQERPAFIRWKKSCWCVAAAQADTSAVTFLLDDKIPLGDRFEVAARILCPGPETVRTPH